MTDGFDRGAAALHRPRPPSMTIYSAVAIAIVAVILGCAHWVGMERGRAAAARTDALATSEYRLLLSQTVGALSCVATAEYHYRQAGDDVARTRYQAARTDLDRTFVQLAGSGRTRYHAPPDSAELRRLARARFAGSDALAAAAAIATPRTPGETARNAAVSRAIDREADRLNDVARQQLDRDTALSNQGYAFVTLLFLCITIGAIVAVLLAVWLSWRSRCRHHLLELRAFDAMARLRAVFSGTSDAIVILDLKGRIEEVNAAASRMLGYAPEELEGHDVAKIVDMADGDLPLAERAGLGAGEITMPTRIDRVARDRDGNAIPVDIALGLMPSIDGTRLVASFRDVSERKAAERTKDDFISTISHELRTPLTSVVGALGLLREGAAGALPDAAARLTDIAENNARRLIRLVNDILDIDRLGSGRCRA